MGEIRLRSVSTCQATRITERLQGLCRVNTTEIRALQEEVTKVCGGSGPCRGTRSLVGRPVRRLLCGGIGAAVSTGADSGRRPRVDSRATGPRLEMGCCGRVVVLLTQA